jgi:beta-1,4-mannosyl-glycoprotein beta-1,4-N-acetylglucosaminyltransferase
MRDDLPHLNQGGWHFSYFMSPDKIKQKINAIGSVEKITNHSLIQTTEIEEKIKSQKDMFDRNIQYRSSIKEHEKVPESLKKLFELNLPAAC